MKTSDVRESKALTEVLEIKRALGAEVAGLPVREAIRETIRRATEEAEKLGFTQQGESHIGGRAVPILRRPPAGE